jgi:hypothetical protein
MYFEFLSPVPIIYCIKRRHGNSARRLSHGAIKISRSGSFILFQERPRALDAICECESVCDLFADLLIRYCAIEMNKLLFLCSDC